MTGRRLRAWTLGVAGALLVAAVAIGWRYSNDVLGPDSPPVRRGEHVIALGESTITLLPSMKAARRGHWAIEWPGGCGELGERIDSTAQGITRRFRLASGAPPDTAARIAGFAFDADPRVWLGLDFESVAIPSRIGRLPAWLVPGRDSTWVILLHGRGAARAEVLRMVPGYHVIGLPILVMGYRNDADAPRSHGGRYRMGLTEWQDLEDAVRYALEQGARDVVVGGCSMGGGIAVQFLRRSELRGHVRAAVLDSPALDWTAVFDQGALKRHVPLAISRWAMTVASMRTGIRWRDCDLARYADELSTPMLIFHGDDDRTVPVRVSVRFAAERPDLVTLVRTPGADHVNSWNTDPIRYETILRAWLMLRGVGIGPPGV